MSEQDTQMISTWLSWDEPSTQEVLKLVQANRNLGSWTFTIRYLRYRRQVPAERNTLLCDHLSNCNKTCKPSRPSLCPYCAIYHCICIIQLYMTHHCSIIICTIRIMNHLIMIIIVLNNHQTIGQFCHRRFHPVNPTQQP